MMIYKGQQPGLSGIPCLNTPLQSRPLLHEFFVLPVESFRQGYFAVLVCQITRIENFESSLCQEEEPNNIHIFDHRFANVVHLLPVVFAIGIRKKSNAAKSSKAGYDINQLGIWVAPNGMEFCLDEYTGSFPDRPAQHELSPELRNLLFDNGKAFAFWLARHWLAANVNRMLSLGQAATKFFDVGGADVCGNNHLSLVSKLEQ